LTPAANKSDKRGESKGLKRLFFFAEGVKQYCPKDTKFFILGQPVLFPFHAGDQ
jgi:hypothetical protein